MPVILGMRNAPLESADRSSGSTSSLRTMREYDDLLRLAPRWHTQEFSRKLKGEFGRRSSRLGGKVQSVSPLQAIVNRRESPHRERLILFLRILFHQILK
jgi:hypothetical protein